MCDWREQLAGKRIGCAMTGSFCTFRPVFEVWRMLKEAGAQLMPIMSFNVAQTDTRFYSAAEARELFEEICQNKILKSIDAVEPIGPKKLLDILIVAPCTGNSMAKIANGIEDTPVTLAVKSHLRNGKPVLIAPSSNDALAANAISIGKLLNLKHIFFVPFRQDDPQKKPNSVVAHFDRIPESAAFALENRQIQPILT